MEICALKVTHLPPLLANIMTLRQADKHNMETLNRLEIILPIISKPQRQYKYAVSAI